MWHCQTPVAEKCVQAPFSSQLSQGDYGIYEEEIHEWETTYRRIDLLLRFVCVRPSAMMSSQITPRSRLFPHLSGVYE